MHHDASIIAPKISGDAGDTAVASVSMAARRGGGGVASKAATMVARTQLATLMLNHHDT